MKFYRQYDYSSDMLGESGHVTISKAGCFIVSLANLANIDPIAVNSLLAKNHCFTQGNMLFNKEKTANLLELKYRGRTTKKPNFICIAETHDTPAPQHFFIYNPVTDEINDPISKKRGWEKCKYSIKSYRLFKKTIKNESLSIKDILEKILEKQKYFYAISDKYNNQKGRQDATNAGMLIREAQKKLGLDISE